MGLNAPLHVLETLLANSGHSNDLVRETCFLFPALRWKPICHERCSLRLEAAYARRES